MKRLAKVSRELERLQSVVSSTGYMMKAKDTVKSKNLEKVAIFNVGIYGYINSYSNPL